MNQKLQYILDIIQQSEKLDAEQKNNLLKAVKDADKELEITAFKLERTEKVKKTTAILLEETIEELEQKRKAVEAQNRELEIETALEKVRTIAMAMRKADDMLDVCKTISQQLESLGIKEIRNVQTAIFYERHGTYMNYEYYAKHDKTIITETTYTNNKLHEEFAHKMLKGKGAYFISHINGNEVKDWIAYQKTTNVFIDRYLETASSLNYYWFSLGPVALGISTYYPLTEDEINLFKRFLKVFELAYQRYLDIEKAEAQAREAQIEAALERVRAHAMGLRRSEELNTIISIIFEELNKLGLPVYECSIFIRHGKSRDFTCWNLSESTQLAKSYNFPFFAHPILDKVLDAIEQKVVLYEFNIDNKELKGYCELLFTQTDFKYAPQEYKDSVVALERLHVAQAIMNHGFLEVIGTEPLSKELTGVLKRFTNVIDLTYTRFLDLQKAEAQARESQIEAALERVRSRTMGMQNSEELREVIHVVYEQFVQLKIFVEHTGFIMDYKARDDMHIWLADQHSVPFEIVIPYFDSPHWNSFIEAKEKGRDFFANHLSFEEKNKFYQDLFKLIPGVPEETLEYYLSCPGLAISTVLLENVGMYIENFSGIPYSDEDNNTLMRFGKVFQQTYTRFLDLQKAEAQSREAQIQLGLERVRARSLAMHHSSELQGVVDAVSQQLHNLAIDINGGVFITINDEVDKDLPIWGSSGAANYIQKVTIPCLDKPIFTQLRDAIKNRNDFLVEEYAHAEKIEFFKHLFNHSPWNLLPPKRKKELLAREGGYARSLAVSNYTSIFIINHNGNKFSEEDNFIMKRFGKVFEQSYTRFLDLQKAEAQNKIIQAENERKTKELEEARELQLAMLPKQIPDHPGLDIKVYMQTATEVGGDYYDFSYKDDGSINIAIGDATGHGMKAGTLVTMMKSFFIANSTNKDIDDFFASSNAAIKNSNLKRMMVGFAMLNIKDHKARFINAAMPPLYHYRKKEIKIVEIQYHNLPLGAMAIEKYKSIEIDLNKGDVLIMMSDGFPELLNVNGDLFGYEGVYSAIEKVADKTPEEIISHFKDEAISWSDKKEPDDDVTFVAIKIK